MWVRSGWPGLRPKFGHGRRVAPIAAQHESPDSLALNRVEFGHQFRIVSCAPLSSKSGNQPSSSVFGCTMCTAFESFPGAVVHHIEDAENRFLALQPFPPDQPQR